MTRRLFTTYFAAVLLLAALCPVYANSHQGPIRLEMSLVSDKIVQGEPIIANYVLTNQSSDDVIVDLGRNREGWVRFEILDEDGHACPPAPNHWFPTGGEVQTRARMCSLKPGETYEGQLVATGSFRLTHPGRYTMPFHVTIPVYPAASDPPAFKPPQAPETFAVTRTLSLSASEYDLIHLRRTALRFRQQMETEKNVSRSITAEGAFFSMPEEVALPICRDMIVHPKAGSADSFLAPLARISSLQALDLIALQARSTTSSPDLKHAARGLLRALFMDGDYDPIGMSRLKQHLFALDGELPPMRTRKTQQ